MRPFFKWDTAKGVANLRKHGIGFGEAMTVFGDPLARIFDDPAHSLNERRELFIGHSARQRLLVVSFTERGPGTRIIGARKATRLERTAYEQNTEKEGT